MDGAHETHGEGLTKQVLERHRRGDEADKRRALDQTHDTEPPYSGKLTLPGTHEDATSSADLAAF